MNPIPPTASGYKQYALGAAVFIAFVGFLIFLSGSSRPSVGEVIPQANAQMVELKAKGGYFPQSQTAKANMPTTLRVKTDSTFDCSSALNIPSLGVRKNLPPSGSTDIAIPPQASGAKLKGTCSMGMYHFEVGFQ